MRPSFYQTFYEREREPDIYYENIHNLFNSYKFTIHTWSDKLLCIVSDLGDISGIVSKVFKTHGHSLVVEGGKVNHVNTYIGR